MMKEIQTWVKHENISRKPCKEATHVIDTRWVMKWKYEQAATSVEEMKAGKQPTTQRIVRARLTLRGFKDMEKNDIARYAGTSARSSQKVLVSEAVRRGWDICTTDIAKAFLQGVTYKELAKLTGEPEREVNFFPPAHNVSMLRMLPGFEGFDPQTEVIHCDTPGTGLVDAPRAFSTKLTLVTGEECQLELSLIDPELCLKVEQGLVILLMTKHVDDLKLCGPKWVINKVIQTLEKHFGALKVTLHQFTNCGGTSHSVSGH